MVQSSIWNLGRGAGFCVRSIARRFKATRRTRLKFGCGHLVAVGTTITIAPCTEPYVHLNAYGSRLG
jgi:hypothetical protein